MSKPVNSAPSFWMVWNPSGRSPTVRHPDPASAKQEAERLARQERGQTFVVLQSIGECRVRDIDWTEHLGPHEMPPF